MGARNITINLGEIERGLPTTENNEEYLEGTAWVPPSAYHDKVVMPKSVYQPWLGILNEFLDPKEESFAVPVNNRMSTFNVDVIHISESGKVDTPINCRSEIDFKQAIGSTDEERHGTLVIAQDLSRAVINTLGMQYDLEPDFFACHLLGTESFRMGNWKSPTVRAPNALPDYVRRAPFYTIEFRRPYHFPGGFKEIVELRSKKTSTPRGALLLKHDMTDAFIFEKISVYKRKGSNIGVILTDKLLSKELPASYMLDIIDESSEALGSGSRIRQVSAQRELATWVERLQPQERRALFDDHEPLALCPVLKIVERTSATFLAQAQCIMSRIAYGHFDEQLLDSIKFSLRILRSLHTNIHDQQQVLGLAKRIAFLRGGENMAEQMQDLQFLADDMAGALKGLEEDVNFLASALSISEGKIVGWITKLALLSLPLSLLSSILTLNDEIRFVVLGGLGVPFVLIVTYFTFLWKPSSIDSLRLYTPKRD